jgi:putative ABC transport system permease protein
MNFRTVWLKVRALVARRSVETELDDEIRFHIDREAEANVERGMSPAEARRTAYVKFGGVERFKEGAREARGTGWLEDLARDVRLSFRSMARSPGFAAAALLTIALGVGGTTAVFSVVRGVLLRPLPFAEPDGLVTVWYYNPPQDIDEDVASFPNFSAWREQSTTLSHVVGVSPFNMSVTGDGEPEEVRAARVTKGFFEMLGVPLALGRGFRDEEAEGDVDSPVVVLSHELWTRRFSADPTILGRTVRLSDVAYEVVGVTAPGSGYPSDVQVWIPLTFAGSRAGLRDAAGSLWLPVMGRLASGASFAQAQTEMSGIGDRLAQADSANNFGTSVRLEPLLETEVGDVRAQLLTLLGAVVLVMLIGVANVANLLLVRGTARAREMAVRLSLGAGKGRLTRQLLTESAALGLAGAVLGTAVAATGVRLLLRFSPPELPRLDSVRVDVQVLAFALALSFGASVVFGLLPALQASRSGQADALRQGGRGNSDGSARVRRAFVAAQFALALVLLVGSGLLVRSFVNLLTVDPGFEPRGALSFRINLPASRYPTVDELRAFIDRAIPALEAVPGAESAAVVGNVFMSRLPSMASISVESRPDLDTRENPVPFDGVSPGYLDALGMRLVSGRTFGPEDATDTPAVAVVSEAFVRTFFPDGEPLGERFTFGDPSPDGDNWITIIGVVRDAKRAGLHAPVRPYVFFPVAQSINSRQTDVVVRAEGDPTSLIGAVREEMGRLDPALPLSNVRTLEQALSSTLAPRRFLMMLVAVFAGAATLLAAIGIYGVMSYLVALRTREIGIRAALGATRQEVLRSVLRQSLRQAGAGVLLGLAGALLVTRYLQSQLFGLDATDPATFMAMSLLLVLVGAAASWIPARRAAGVQPSIALREE